MNCAPETLTELMVGFFSGELSGVEEKTIKGNYQWWGEKPKKGWVPVPGCKQETE